MSAFFVLGLGKSGQAVANFLYAQQKTCYVWDDDPEKQKAAKAQGFVLGWPENEQPCVIASPGIADHWAKQRAYQNNCRVICDIQLFFDFFPYVNAIAVTGSNGKSTTCALVHHALQSQNVPSVLTGNIGIPPFSTLIKGIPQNALHIFELSSYQLELCEYLPLKVAVLLNLFPHHLERHETMENYLAIKEKIFAHAEKKVVGNNQWLQKWHTNAHTLFHAADLSDEWLSALSQEMQIFFRPIHNKLNGSAAFHILNILGEKPLFHGFKGLFHRQEFVAQRKHIFFWNDSKATNPDAAFCALNTFFDENAILLWIAGGALQKDDLSPLIPMLPKIHHAFIIGQSQDRFGHFLTQHRVPFHTYQTLEQALFAAFHLATSQRMTANIVFSPACASFDQFRDFEARGDFFKNAVLDLTASIKFP
jgi:UDP-N-acetylmuramoylalanine--D-glutamate ligase